MDEWLSHLLVERGLLSHAQLAELEHPGEVWTAATRRQWLRDEQIIQLLSQTYKVPVADLDQADARAATLLPESIARKHRVLPLSVDDRQIQVATADPRDYDAEQAIAFVTGRDVAFRLAAPDALLHKLDEIYRPERSIERILDRLNPVEIETVEEPAAAPPSRDPALDAPVARLVDAMISDGVREGASDIHAEPEDGATVVRYRVDGVLREIMRLPGSAGSAMVRRAKILAKLDVTDPLHPHDGRASIKVDGHVVDLRVSTVPIARRGEKVVIRILDQSNLRASVPALGLSEDEESLLDRLLGHREGMILVTGPTGSGKTTTLYAALNQLKTGKVNIVTVEDPVEYDLGGISQIQVNEAQGLTFASVLRSVLRQDPDIVLVGEIRDFETAKTAVQAGLSGHFVLSTLHTNDAPSAVVRLRDIGIEAFKIGAVVKGVVAQRLVRRVCPHCAKPIALDAVPVEARPPASWDNRPLHLVQAAGCDACNGLGYKGRLAILEIMPVDEAVAKLIDAGQPPEALAAAARRIGMRSLWESGLDRFWQGLTTLEELVRVLGERVHDDGSTAPNRPSVMLVPEPVRQRVHVAEHAAPASGAPKVLVADDDPQMRRLVRTVLERDGFVVAEAGDGLDALEAIAQQRFDLIMLDLDMPRLDGLGVLEELGASVTTAGLPVIVLTARAGAAECEVLDLGAQDFLTKPVRPTALSARVRAVLRRAQA